MTAALLPLATQPQGVPWPTTPWPRADLDSRVDRAALDDLLDHAFGDAEPNNLERTNGVVVVQNGAIVAERYRKDVDPDRPFISWSMAKSITSALIGILVREGKLDTQPIPVKEWPEGDRRRRITIDQMLRMVDGLRFREAEDLGDGSVRYYARKSPTSSRCSTVPARTTSPASPPRCPTSPSPRPAGTTTAARATSWRVSCARPLAPTKRECARSRSASSSSTSA